MLEKIGRVGNIPRDSTIWTKCTFGCKIFVVGIVGLLGCIFITVRHNKAVHSAVKQSTLLVLSHRHEFTEQWMGEYVAGRVRG